MRPSCVIARMRMGMRAVTSHCQARFLLHPPALHERSSSEDADMHLSVEHMLKQAVRAVEATQHAADSCSLRHVVMRDSMAASPTSLTHISDASACTPLPNDSTQANFPRIHVLSSTHLHPPARDAASCPHRTRLAPADWLVQPVYTIRVLLFYEHHAQMTKGTDGAAESSNICTDAAQQTHADAAFMDGRLMRSAFARVLAAYPLLTGRFEACDDGTVDIVHGGSSASSDHGGVPFVLATSTLRLSDLPLTAEQYTSVSVLPPSLSLLDEFDASAPLTQPLCWIQHTRFACGGVCVGVHMHHYLADGEAFFILMHDWVAEYSAMRRAREHKAESEPDALAFPPPCLDRSVVMPRGSAEEIAAAATLFRQDAYTVRAPHAASQSASSAPAPAASASTSFCEQRVLRFDAVELSRLKVAASDPQRGCTVPFVSTFEALSAHLMQAIFRARHPATENSSDSSSSDPVPEQVSSTVAVSFRSPARHEPALPNRLFANVLFKVCAALPAAAALHPVTGLGATASAVHRSIASLDRESVHRALCWVASVPLKSQIVLTEAPGEKISIPSWTRFNIFDPQRGLCFEPAHPPMRLCFPYAAQGVDGLLTLMETPTHTGGAIDVYIGLRRPHMERFLRDPALRQFRTEATASHHADSNSS